LIALIFGLAFSTLGTPAQAGLFNRRARRATACSTAGYSYQSYGYAQTAAPCAPCGQQATASYNYATTASYGYATAQAAAPVCPMRTAGRSGVLRTTAPVYYPSNGPGRSSRPRLPLRLRRSRRSGSRWSCNGTSCKLMR
jgi:hypothetical protein